MKSKIAISTNSSTGLKLVEQRHQDLGMLAGVISTGVAADLMGSSEQDVLCFGLPLPEHQF